MKNVCTFLLKFRNDVFKLLPMREELDNGNNNYLSDYVESILISAEGALTTFAELEAQKNYIYVINNLNYLKNHSSLEFSSWRKVILNCTRCIDDLRISYSGGKL